MNEPIKGRLGAVRGLKSVKLGSCPVHSVLADLLFYDCNAYLLSAGNLCNEFPFYASNNPCECTY